MARDRDDDRPRKKTRPAREEPEEVEEIEEIVEEVEEERPKKRAKPAPTRAAEPPRRKKPAEDDEEIVEEVEEEEERPRKKAKPARASADDEDDRPRKKKSRPADDDDEDDRPKKKKGRRSEPESASGGMGKLLVLGGVGVLALVLVGGGMWWFLGGDGGRVGKPAPPREMAKKYFAYKPASAKHVHVTSPVPGGGPVLFDLPGQKDDIVKQADIDFSARFDNGISAGNDRNSVTVYYLKKPLDLASVVNGRPAWTSRKIGGKDVQVMPGGFHFLFMVNPTLLVVVGDTNFRKPKTATVEAVLALNENSFNVPEEQWDVLTRVSGYEQLTSEPKMEVTPFSSTKPVYSASGRRKVDGKSEWYVVHLFDSEATAAKAMKEFIAFDREMNREMKKSNPNHTSPPREVWRTGKHMHTMRRTDY